MHLTLLAAAALATTIQSDEKEPLPAQQRAQIRDSLDTQIKQLTARISDEGGSVQLYSARGTAYFHRGRFAEAVADFDRMIDLDPDLATSHWRRGIALYYVGRYKDSARQFEIYHTFDNVDRENGIWRYLAQVKAYGGQRARKDLLKYKKDDRAPFPDLYALFAGTIEPGDVLARIAEAEIDATQRQKRYFYAHLYLGLHAFTLKDHSAARKHLRKAVANPWGQRAGGGPGYMWHVARVHWNVLAQEKQSEK